MFLKRTYSKNFTYLSIVETYRQNQKVKHRTLLQLGREDHVQKNKTLQQLVNSIDRVSGVHTTKAGFTFNDLKEEHRYQWGAVKVYRKIWKRFRLNNIISQACNSEKRKFDLPETVFAAALARLMRPSSKLKIHRRQNNYLGIKQISLPHLYRAMDALAIGKEKIEQMLFERQKSLFNLSVDVVLYDVTTLAFESTKNDELKEFGYSKDRKFNEVQLVVSLLVDTEGRPIGFDTFPGNTFEGHTLIETLKKLRHRFNIRKVIIVADRGINSKLNLHQIKQAGFDYIVGSRLKNLPVAVQNQALELSAYTPLKKDKAGEIMLSYRALEHINKVATKNKNGSKQTVELSEQLICTWSQKRASKDRHDRQRLVERAEQLLKTPSKVSIKRGVRRFISKADDSQLSLDQARIDEDAKWDGFYGIQCSQQELNVTEVLAAYHSLWKIEESFRVIKHTLQARPIFHWTAQRIKGHMVLCFISFLLQRTLELALQKRKLDVSVSSIREALSSLQVSVLKADDRKLYLSSKIEGLAADILRSLRIAFPKHVSDVPPID